MTQLEGSIAIDSVVGLGSTFRVVPPGTLAPSGRRIAADVAVA